MISVCIYKKTFILIVAMLATSIASAQNPSNKNVFDENSARTVLNASLNDNSGHNVLNSNDVILSDKKNAIEFAERILFDVYGRRNIKKQRPYSIFNIDNYWILSGTLRKNWHGGTFIMIIDSHDCRIVRITHGK